MIASNDGERKAVGAERVEYRTTLLPGWGWLRWLEVSGRAGGGSHVVMVLYGIFGWGQRAEERESFRGVVTPTRLVYTQKVYECCAPQQFWLQTDLAEVKTVEISGSCCGTPNINVHVTGDPSENTFAPKLACCVAGQHGPFRPGQGACCAPPKPYYTLSCIANPEAFVDAANRAKAHHTGNAK